MNQSNVVPQSAQMTVEEYLTERMMSNLPVLLVEGDDDDIFFQLIRDEILSHQAGQTAELIDLLQKLEIDTPSNICSPLGEVLGNRDKVEHICHMADSIPFQGLLSGFVDREFREFETIDRIIDNLACHNQIRRIVWSRGHSIENYLFDWSVLRDGLRNYGINPSFQIQEVLKLLKNNFSLIFNYASAVSLAARDTGLLSVAQRSFDKSMFSFENDELRFDVHKWDALLGKNQRLDQERRSSLIATFEKYIKPIETAPNSILQWVCHGHIGMNFIWAVFQASVYNICKQREIKNAMSLIRHPKVQDRFITFAVIWIKSYLALQNGSGDTPMLCFDKLISQLEQQ